jgi:hypothetical protein
VSEAQEFLADPCWLPYSLDNEFSTLSFVRTDAATLRSAPFLDSRFLSKTTIRKSISLSTLLASAKFEDVTSAPPMIFHSAFCCSTLMAKALDLDGSCLSLKEPEIMMTLANCKRMFARAGRSQSEFQDVYKLVMSLLKRRFSANEVVMIKPTNAANNLLQNVLASKTPVLLMYSGLEDFLISVLKKGEACKSFMRTQFNIFSLDDCALARIPHRQAMTFTDLQVATLVWRHQMELFAMVKKTMPSVTTMRDTEFLSDPEQALKISAKSLNLPHTLDHIGAAAKSSVFQQNVKFSEKTMNPSRKEEESNRIRMNYHQEIATTLEWAKTLQLSGEILPGI